MRDEADALAALLDQISPDPAVQVIVSAARPVEDRIRSLRARHPAVTWAEGEAGRGRQLNAGAGAATGEWLWFVHVDSRLPAGWLDAFRDLDSTGGPDEPRVIIGGAFRFALDSPAWQARLLERAVALRSRLFNLPYGDQGLFVRRQVFEAMGGFAPVLLMEDVDFVRRLTRLGRLRHLTLRLTTSARRWEQEGWFRRSASNLMTLALYGLGVSPERLARRYYGQDGHGAGPGEVREHRNAD